MEPILSRRRLVGISAAATGLALIPFGGIARADSGVESWRGKAMGAVASLQIHHHDRSVARRLIERAVAETQRLEQVFSLYRDDSALVSLNRHGVLVAPPKDLVDLLVECRRYFDLTGGAFDPTVQALWTLHRRHFSQVDAAAGGPSQRALEEARGLIGFDRVSVGRDRIAFPRGMSLTLNGIAQGYVTDRIVDLLRSEGIDRSIIDMGESRVIGPRPDGSPWRVGIVDPDHPSRVAGQLEMVNQAAATSGGYGFRFDTAGAFNHLFDPVTGQSPKSYLSVTTVMDTATAADALSTAFSLMSECAIGAALRSEGPGRVHLIMGEGHSTVIRSG
jgi:thiamine biosynthesis lipoprotein